MSLNHRKIQTQYTIYYPILFYFVLTFPLLSSGQSHNHWTRNFNEESSLLSGAVVGGGAGPSAIYYNPASIAEITESISHLMPVYFLLIF